MDCFFGEQLFRYCVSQINVWLLLNPSLKCAGERRKLKLSGRGAASMVKASENLDALNAKQFDAQAVSENLDLMLH